MAAEFEHEAVLAARESVLWWPAGLAFVLLGVVYALVSDRLTVGPPWLLLVLAVVAVVAGRVLGGYGMLSARRWVAVTALALVTASITASVAILVVTLVSHTADALVLLQGGALLWVSNILTFALWYWELDGGGPAHRHASKRGSSDFAFPQKVLGGRDDRGWTPEFVDYVFLAFNTNTAFSPTDTMVLGRRAKLLMMYQSVVALVTVAVLVARAINAI